MVKKVLLLVLILGMFCTGCEHSMDYSEMVPVSGSDFYIGKYEVTQSEWNKYMDKNPSAIQKDDYPVENVTWYQCVEYCNKRSEAEGITPYYNIERTKEDTENQNKQDTVKWTVTENKESKGYRLPSEKEWETAARGGNKSKNYTYSGSNDANEVSWNWKNAGEKELSGNWNWDAISGNKTTSHAVGQRQANEIGLYDMSGNVREWCYDWYSGQDYKAGFFRVCKGGGWIGDIMCCEIGYKGKFEANGIGQDQGFRLCKSE